MATRIAILNSHPIQYYAPFWRHLNTASDLDVTVIYFSDSSLRNAHDPGYGRGVRWDVDLMAGIRNVFVDGASRRTPAGFFSLTAPQVWRMVREGRYDALVIHGHGYAANHIALAAAKCCGTRVFMRCDSQLARRGWKARLRRPLLGTLYWAFDGFLAAGQANAAFYEAMGVPPEKITLVPFAVDNARFCAGCTPAARSEMRRALGIPDATPVILFVGRFAPAKRTADLLRAARMLHCEGHDLQVVLVGSGEMEARLRSVAAEPSSPPVHFAGFVNQAVLPRWYAMADVFVLPSEAEPWGLVVNEAMCAGLPVVVSDKAGCAADLVHDNGAVYPAGDIGALADALRPLLAEPGLRRRMGERSRQIIAGWSYVEGLDGIRAALRALPPRGIASGAPARA